MAGSLSLRFMQQIQPIVDILQAYQLLVGTLFDDATTVHYQNPIRHLNSRRPVSNDECGLPF